MGVRPFLPLYFCKKSSHIILSSEFFSIAKNEEFGIFKIYILHIFTIKKLDLHIYIHLKLNFANVYL